MNVTSEIHMGKIVEKHVRLSMVSITDVSKSLNVNRRTLYNWFTKQSIPEYIVVNIGKCIGYDFSEQIPQLTERKTVIVQSDLRIANVAGGDDDTYKMKYLHLLEKYNLMLEEIRLSRFSI